MKTSERMSRVRQRDTPIEVALRSAVWRQGGRFRLHLGDVPGHPDFGSRKSKVAVFVDGCFWHGCPTCYKAPTVNARFWKRKITYNRSRRASVKRQLESTGWTVVEVWGHEIERNVNPVANRVMKALLGRDDSAPPN